MEDQTLMCSPTSNCFLTSGLYNVMYKFINVSKSHAKCFGLVIIKIPKTSIIIPLWSSYYIPHNPQNTIIQTALKHYNEFRHVITEALRWVEMTTDTGIKLRVVT